MELVKKELEVAKETSEVYGAAASVIAAAFAAAKDGWQTGQDLPIVLATALPGLLSAVEGIDKLDDEHKDDLAAAVRTHGVMAGVLAGEIIGGIKALKSDESPSA